MAQVPKRHSVLWVEEGKKGRVESNVCLSSGSLGVGHEEPPVGPRFVPVQQDGPKDLQLGHERVSELDTGQGDQWSRENSPHQWVGLGGEKQDALGSPPH